MDTSLTFILLCALVVSLAIVGLAAWNFSVHKQNQTLRHRLTELQSNLTSAEKQMDSLRVLRWSYRDLWDRMPEDQYKSPAHARLARELAAALPRMAVPENAKVALTPRQMGEDQYAVLASLVSRTEDPVLAKFWTVQSFEALHALFWELLLPVVQLPAKPAEVPVLGVVKPFRYQSASGDRGR